MKTKTSKTMTAAEMVEVLPPPRPGLEATFPSVETACLYMKKHGLNFKKWDGGLLVVRMPQAESAISA